MYELKHAARACQRLRPSVAACQHLALKVNAELESTQRRYEAAIRIHQMFRVNAGVARLSEGVGFQVTKAA